jgi:hypothetical protein
LGFRSVKKLMLWNDAQGRTMGDLLTKLDVAIQKSAPAPADPLVGVGEYALGMSEPRTRRGGSTRAWRRTLARIRFGRAGGTAPGTVRLEGQADTESERAASGQPGPASVSERVLDAMGAGQR